jgi:hypothetical protein
MKVSMKSVGMFSLTALVTASLMHASSAQATQRRFSSLHCQPVGPHQGTAISHTNDNAGEGPNFFDLTSGGNSASTGNGDAIACPIDSDNAVSFPQTNLAWVDTNSSSTTVQACVTFFGSVGGACGPSATGNNGQLSGSGLNAWTLDEGLDYAYLYVATGGVSIQGYGFNTTQ